MLYLLHGENTAASSQKMATILESYALHKYSLLKIDTWTNLTPTKLREKLASHTLFSDLQVVVSEYLHSLPISKNRTALIETLNSLYEEKIISELVILEKKKLTALMLKKFPAAAVELFESSKLVWQFLSSLSFSSYQTLVTVEKLDPFYLLAMLERQLNLLIQAKTNYPLKLAPFQVSALKSQAQKYSLPQLLAARHRLLAIEFQSKTLSKGFNLEQLLGTWLASI
jgi:hypothetical protein